jgi:nickel transport protein
MKWLKWFILSLCMVKAHSSLLHAHAISYELGSGGIAVQAFFDDHQPAKGLSVTVLSPGSSEKFQTGKTDANGRFVFSPDSPGQWEMLIFDQMGHRLEITIPVNEAMKTVGNAAENTMPLYLKIIMGIAIICALFYLTGRMKPKTI